MEITGRIYDKKTLETLPSANVYVSDKDGNIIGKNLGAAANSKGIFNLDVPVVRKMGVYMPVSPYITASFVGYGKKTLKLGDRNKYDFPMNSGQELAELTITSEPVTEKKDKKNKTIMIASLAVLGVGILGAIIYKLTR